MHNPIQALKNQISYEKHMLNTWRKADDLSLLPAGWSATKQSYFVKGMEHALQIIKDEMKI